MKRIIYSLTAVLALVACSKEQESLDYELYDGEVSTIIAKFNPVTKTTVELAGDQAEYTWEESETIKVFDGTNALTYTVVDRNAGTFQSAISPAGELAYAVSPADALSSPSAGSYELTIKDNYIDYKPNVSNAIMVAGAPSDVIDGKPVFAFQHAAALMRFTYENVPVGTTGLKFSTNKKINGTFTVSGSTPELTLANASGTTETKLTLASAVSSANTSIIFYVPIPTGNYSTFTVTLFNGEGDIASTTKTMNAAFTATKGHVINTPVITLNYVLDASYQKITNAKDLTDGDYLIVYEDESLAFDGNLETLDASSNTISVSITEGVIEPDDDVNNAVFTYNSTKKTLKSHSGYYIGKDSNANGMDTNSSTEYENTISFDGDGNVVIVSSGGAYLRYNATSGQDRFRYFKSSTYTGQKAIQLYKKVASSSSPQLSIPQGLYVDATTKTVSWHTVKNADSYVLVVGGDDYSSDISISGNIASATIDIADEYYDVSVVAVSSDPASIRNSAAATLTAAKFGNPTLSSPSSFVIGTVTDNSIEVSWTGDAHATKYHCTIAPADADAQEPTSTSVTFTGLTNGTDYVITVFAIDGTGAYADSAPASTSSIKASEPVGADPVEGVCFNISSYTSLPDGWTCSGVNTGSYFAMSSGGSMISPSYNLSGYKSATVSVNIATLNSGTNPTGTVHISYDGGKTWTQSKSGSPTSSSYVTISFNLSSLSKNVVVKLTHDANGTKSLRVQKFSLTASD